MLTALTILAAFVLAVLLVASLKSNKLHVERTLLIRSAPEKIHMLINDFNLWASWSPYEAWEPTMTKTFSGAAKGVGAIYEWNGKGKVGHGRMEITDSVPTKITIKLDFFKPFEAHHTATFEVLPKGEVTAVTWSMDGARPFMAKVMSIFMNMDKMIGRDFEKGLSNLALITEGRH